MTTDRESLAMAAKAAGIKVDMTPYGERVPNSAVARFIGDQIYFYSTRPGQGNILWSPRTDDGDALRLAVAIRSNLLFDGAFHHVGTNRHVSDICCLGNMDEIRSAIFRVAVEIGKAMP